MKENKKDSITENNTDNKLTRRAAMNRIGLAAFSTATMLLLLNKPEKAQSQDSSTEPGDPGDF